MNLSKTSAFSGSLGVLALIFLGSPTANAALNVGSGMPTVTSAGANYTYTYTVNLLPAETLAATGDPNTTGEFVFYDFAGYVPGTAVYNNDGQSGETFTATNMLVGPVITGARPVPADNPLVQNVIFAYTGPTIVDAGTTNIALGTFDLTSTFGPSAATRARKFVYQASDNFGGTDSGNVNISLPTLVPEPGGITTFAFTGVCLAGLIWRSRRGRAGKITS